MSLVKGGKKARMIILKIGEIHSLCLEIGSNW